MSGPREVVFRGEVYPSIKALARYLHYTGSEHFGWGPITPTHVFLWRRVERIKQDIESGERPALPPYVEGPPPRTGKGAGRGGRRESYPVYFMDKRYPSRAALAKHLGIPSSVVCGWRRVDRLIDLLDECIYGEAFYGQFDTPP